MTPLPPELRSPPDPVDVLARTIWGEARGEDRAGREMVAAVIMNRVNMDLRGDGKPDWWGESVVEVCLLPFQFSCWNAHDVNRKKLLAVTTADAAFRDCLDIARRAVAGQLADRTGGATHYADIPLTLKINGGRLPTWLVGRKPLMTHGNHTFFRIAGTTIAPDDAARYADAFILLWGVCNVALRFITTGPVLRRGE